MDLITPQRVIDAIELYYQGGLLNLPLPSGEGRGEGASNDQTTSPPLGKSVVGSRLSVVATDHRRLTTDKSEIQNPNSEIRPKIRLSFIHGLGDCAYFAHLILLYVRRGYDVEVECTPDKRILFEAAGATTVPFASAPLPPFARRRRGVSRGPVQPEPLPVVAPCPPFQLHPWSYPPGGTHAGHGNFWQGSKIAHNLSEPPLPHIGDKAALWDEYCASRIDIRPHLPAEAVQTAERWLANLPRPIVLLHTKGNTGQHHKSLPDAITVEFYKSLLERFDSTILLLDWDNRVPRLASYRVRHLDEFGPCALETLLALMTQADLMIGVDSGPLHAARFTSIPTVGLWMPGHYPATYTLPRREQLNVVLADHTREWNRFKRIPWNIVEHPGAMFDPIRLAEICVQMLAPPRYLTAPAPSTSPPLSKGGPGGVASTADRARELAFAAATSIPHSAESEIRNPNSEIARDVQLQQFIREWCRGKTGNALSGFSDRHRSFDVLFQEISRRFETPTIVETGTIRAEEDWGGAGFFTYLAGAYLSRRGGQIHSVDLSADNCRFARAWTEIFNAPAAHLPPLPLGEGWGEGGASLCPKRDVSTVTIHCQDSVAFLQNFPYPIDVLYLDSLDTTEPNHAEHAERELDAARPRLHDRSLIVIDDTPWQGGAFVGKGARVAPLLLAQGWRILYAGYQVVFAKASPPLSKGGQGGAGENVQSQSLPTDLCPPPTAHRQLTTDD